MPRVTRRDFLTSSVGAVAGIVGGGALAAAQAPLRFGIITDMHYADADPAGTRFYRESLGKVRDAVTTLRQEGASFLAVLGDIKDMAPKESEARTLSHLAAISTEIRRFGGPTFHVLGNHDMDNISKPQVLAGITNTDVDPDRTYYAFSRGGVRFVALDACFLQNGAAYDHGNFDWRDTWIPAAELQWLERELADAREPVIVLAHQRLDRDGDVFVKNSAEVRAILEKPKKVLAVFTGHDHAGAITQVNGIHYYTQKAIVEGSGLTRNAFTLVDVHPDGAIAITGFRQAVSQTLGAPAVR
jgi:hypothetical protein